MSQSGLASKAKINASHGAENPSAALLIDVILTRLFDYLDVKDLKNSRMVCTRWLICAELPFRKRTRVSFNFAKHDKENKNARDDDSTNRQINADLSWNLNDFFISSTRNVPLNCLTLGGNIPWTAEELMDFFDKEGKQITDLKIAELKLRLCSSQEKIAKTCNFIYLLGEKVYLNLKKLVIINENSSNGTNYRIPIQLLENVENLCLRNCSISLFEGRIVPKDLWLENCDYFSELYDAKAKVVVNEFVDFKKMKSFKLIIKKDEVVFLDMVDGSKIEYVHLRDVKIVDWINSNWTIDKFNFEHMHYRPNLNLVRQNQKMKVNEVVIRWNIDIIRYLPPSIQRLSIADCAHQRERINLNDHIYFHDLAYLKTNLSQIGSLPIFSICSNLRDLELETSTHFGPVNFQRIPQSVKRLKIHCHQHTGLRMMTTQMENLAVLVLKVTKAEYLNQVLSTLQSEIVVLHFENYQWCLDRDNLVNNLILDVILNQRFSKKTFIGEFNWKKGDFERCPLAFYVDRKSTCFCFWKGKGMAITKSHFEEMANF